MGSPIPCLSVRTLISFSNQKNLKNFPQTTLFNGWIRTKALVLHATKMVKSKLLVYRYSLTRQTSP